MSDPDGYTNVREGKDTSSKILGTIKSGETIEVLNNKGNWWQVMTRDNEIGYIHKSRIKKR
ncbi:SH3 domain-containing protein [Capnocytophaga catalasegens]|uniref:SH3 domain-containing protein n=1 Tax=Capnocytophaga catalasegens TaxID=1004260 RepID=UPI0035A25B0B